MKKYKFNKIIARFGILFFILFFVTSIFFVAPAKAKVYCNDGRVVDTQEECTESEGEGEGDSESTKTPMIKSEESEGEGEGDSESRGIDLTLDDVVSIIQKVAGYFYSIAIALAVILTTYIGIVFFTAGGDEQQVGKAKKMMIWLVVGAAVLLIGRGIITLVENILTMAG